MPLLFAQQRAVNRRGRVGDGGCEGAIFLGGLEFIDRVRFAGHEDNRELLCMRQTTQQRTEDRRVDAVIDLKDSRLRVEAELVDDGLGFA